MTKEEIDRENTASTESVKETTEIALGNLGAICSRANELRRRESECLLGQFLYDDEEHPNE